MKPYLVDVPVRIQLWNRPECLRKQYEVLKQARPSVLFLISDGGRNETEHTKILESRKILEDIDWECTVHKLFMDENQGMYTMMRKANEFIWSKTDRCIFLEDDYVPAVSFFSFCAELLEKYKDDDRIEMITGFNPIGVYDDASPNDYFFSEEGWAIWGTAFWKRTIDNYVYPLPYEKDLYIKNRLKDNLSPFWYQKAEKYINGELADNHIPGGEYFHAANSVLHHRVSIIPSKNMISNIGIEGTHAQKSKAYEKYQAQFFNTKTYEIEGEINHPQYVIDDKHYADLYNKALLRGDKYKWAHTKLRFMRAVELILSGNFVKKVVNKIKKRSVQEK